MRLPWLLTFALATQAVVGQTLAPGQFAELEGLRLWYRDSGGTGLPVIFLHAASGSSEMWEHQLPPFVAAGSHENPTQKDQKAQARADQEPPRL